MALHLRGRTDYEIAGVLGIVQSQVSRLVTAIRIKALAVWGDTPPKPRLVGIKLTPGEARERRRAADQRHLKTYWARHREELIARQRAKRAQNRDEINARQRTWRREKRRERL